MPLDPNQFNINMRSQPWYQKWFRDRGLDPNKVHLSDSQRAELAKASTLNGMALPQGMIIDPAGNMNKQHGFAGQPGWLKALEIGGAAAGGALFGGPALASLFSSGGAPGGAAVGSLAGGLDASGAIPLTTFASGAGYGVPATVSGVGGLNVSAAGGGLGKIFSNVLSRGAKGGSGDSTDTTGNLADVASGLGAYAGAQANNRTEMANLGQNYDSQMLSAQADRNANESDALRKLNTTSYLMNGGAKPWVPPSLTTNGKTYASPDLSYMAAQPASDAQKQGASTLQAQLMQRLQPGGSYMPQDPAKYAKQGVGEKVANTGSLIASGLGFARNIFGK